MFNEIISKFEGFFSRAFWFGSFLPVALVGTIHLILLELVYPNILPIDGLLEADLAGKTTGVVFVFGSMVVLAYVLSPFIPFFRGLLDGSLLPVWLRDRLRDNRLPGWRRAAEHHNNAKVDRAFFQHMYNFRSQQLWPKMKKDTATDQVLAAGKSSPEVKAGAEEPKKSSSDGAKVSFDPDKIDKAGDAVEALRMQMLSIALPEKELVERAVSALIEAQDGLDETWPRDLREKLDKARNDLIPLLREADSESEYRLAQVPSAQSRSDLLPTRIGDARRLVEGYCNDTYGVEFDYLWTRILMVLPDAGETGFYRQLNDSQAQANFSTLAFSLALTVPLAWLPLLLFTSSTPWLFLTVGFLSPIVLRFLYELVVQSQFVFGEVARAAVDRYRLEVLTKIAHQPMPSTLATERALWTALREACRPGNTIDVALSSEQNK